MNKGTKGFCKKKKNISVMTCTQVHYNVVNILRIKIKKKTIDNKSF